MAEIKDKIKKGLDEARILVLGAEVLVGFQFQSIFQHGFEQLPDHAQYLKVGGLALLLIALTLLMLPAPYHHIVEGGEDTERFHTFISKAIMPALLPFACGLGIDLFVAGEKVGGLTTGVAFGVAGLLAALWFWYGLEVTNRRFHRHGEEKGRGNQMETEQPRQGATELKTRIEHALSEARVVLPGAQALLGFQFATMLTESFDTLPATSKYIHLGSLAAIALCTVLLMTPAAYHRIVEQGQDTEHFFRFCSRVVLAAMVPLALGLTGDFYVVLAKVLKSGEAATAGAVVLLAFTLGAWFGYTAYMRGRSEAAGRDLQADAA
jgi:hypothetical protein